MKLLRRSLSWLQPTGTEKKDFAGKPSYKIAVFIMFILVFRAVSITSGILWGFKELFWFVYFQLTLKPTVFHTSYDASVHYPLMLCSAG